MFTVFLMKDKKYIYTISEFAAIHNGKFPTKSDLQRLSNKANWGMNLYTKAFKKINGLIMIDPEEFWNAYNLTPSAKENRKKFCGFSNRTMKNI